MDRQEFEQQISALRQGKLRLEPPEENGLSQFAGGTIYELRQYISAVETGYRVLWGLLERNMGKVKAGETTLGELIVNQWSDEAALGYAYLAACMIGLSPDRAVQLLETLGDVMEHYDLDYVKALHRGLVDGGGTEGRQIAGATDGGETPHSTAFGGNPPLDRGGFDGGEAQE